MMSRKTPTTESSLHGFYLGTSTSVACVWGAAAPPPLRIFARVSERSERSEGGFEGTRERRPRQSCRQSPRARCPPLPDDPPPSIPLSAFRALRARTGSIAAYLVLAMPHV